VRKKSVGTVSESCLRSTFDIQYEAGSRFFSSPFATTLSALLETQIEREFIDVVVFAVVLHRPRLNPSRRGRGIRTLSVRLKKHEQG